MRQILPIFKREFLGYFRSPVAYVFLIAFLIISVSLAFSRYGGFFRAGVASMESYFTFFPWLFMFIVPAVGMRLWSEEKRSGTLELLFTLPVTTLEAVLGKFLAGWAFLALVHRRVAPAGVLFGRTNPVMIQGLVLAGIPAMHRVSPDPFTVFTTGDRVRMSPARGIIERVAARAR